MKKRNAAAYIGLIAAALFFLWPARVSAQKEDVAAQGLYVGDVEVSGMTEAEAKAAVEAYVDSLGEKSLTVKTGGYTDRITLKQLGLSWDNREIVGDALRYGKQGSLLKRYKEMKALDFQNQIFPLSISFDEREIQSFVESLTLYNIDPSEPALTWKDGVFTVTGGTDGICVDVSKTVGRVRKVLEDIVWNHGGFDTEAAVEVIKPQRDPELLKEVRDKLGSYSSGYSSGNLGRSQSLELSARKVNGTLIWPGETVSVSMLMGPRTIAGGYGVAGAYIGGNVTESVGAGICQTASTLYAAALYAELAVVERYSHSMTVNYMPAALDATIYAGGAYDSPQKDLKIRNDYKYPVYIAASAGGGTVSVEIYGKEERPADRAVAYVSCVISEIWPTEITWIEDPALPYGHQVRTQGAYAGVTASLTKVVSVNGTVTERMLMHTDQYKMVNEKWSVGVNSSLAFDDQGNIVEKDPPAEIWPLESSPAGEEGRPQEFFPESQSDRDTGQPQM